MISKEVPKSICSDISSSLSLYFIRLICPSNCKQSVNLIKMMNPSSIFLSMILLPCFIILPCHGRPQRSWRSMQCLHAGPPPPPGSCLYGELATPCGVVCKKGPSEICGGSGDQYGVCGDGLTCSDCNRCTGCSYAAFKCFSDTKCVSYQDIWL